jgi:Flp pilus assembly protein TadG
MKSLKRIMAKCRGFDQRGIAAVEFALVLPFMLYLYFGGFELIQGVMIHRQASLTATTVGNIVSQYTSISASTQLPDIMNVSTQIFSPYASSNASVVVSLVTIDSTGKATVTWSQALNTSPRSTGSTVTVPGSLDIANTSLIFSEVTYAYTPTYDFIGMGTKNLHASIFMVPRASSTINLNS